MEHIVEQDEAGIRIVKMASGKSNAMSPALIDELLACARAAAGDESVKGVVLASDRPRFFSPGFDVNEVFALDRPRMREFFARFIDLYEALLAMPKPVVAAVSGHAVAGGGVLALTADQRVFCEGEFRFALTEVDLGVELPAKVRRMLIRAAGLSAATEVLLGGVAIQPLRALALGLANEIASPADVLSCAIGRCRVLAGKPPQAFAAIKRRMQNEARIWETPSDRAELDKFLDWWFSEESVHARRALTESLRR
jgi:enoyl-CoA hydratase/carnithine racemase